MGYQQVGAVIGSPSTTIMSNVTLTGLVKVEGDRKIGGMLGGSCYGNYSDLLVNVYEKSYVSARSESSRNYVGGVFGFMGENYRIISNVSSNIDVHGNYGGVGGISGCAYYGNQFINCISSGNVTLEQKVNEGMKLAIGGIAGVWVNGQGTLTFTNCSYTGKLSSIDLNRQ